MIHIACFAPPTVACCFLVDWVQMSVTCLYIIKCIMTGRRILFLSMDVVDFQKLSKQKRKMKKGKIMVKVKVKNMNAPHKHTHICHGKNRSPDRDCKPRQLSPLVKLIGEPQSPLTWCQHSLTITTKNVSPPFCLHCKLTFWTWSSWYASYTCSKMVRSRF